MASKESDRKQQERRVLQTNSIRRTVNVLNAAHSAGQVVVVRSATGPRGVRRLRTVPDDKTLVRG